MKIRDKILATIGTAWLVFLGLAYIGLQAIDKNDLRAMDYYLVSFVLLGILSTGLLVWLLRVMIVRRLENLNLQISSLDTKDPFLCKVDVEGDDELTSVAHEINSMLTIIKGSRDFLETRIKQRTHELMLANSQLQLEITERKTIEKELIESKKHLARLAHFDSLTGLPNRVFFNEVLNKALVHAARHRRMLALLFIDLDNFKQVNDQYGHAAGDTVLKEAARYFSQSLRAGDTVARLGGDEFIVLINDIAHPKFASPIAEKLLQTCLKPIRINEEDFYVSPSIGICVFPNDGLTIEDLQRNADAAMYKAKRAGGGVFQYFTHDMDTQAHEHIKLDAALHRSLSNQSLKLAYQPKLNLRTGLISGMEALIRWEDPDLGLIPAEKTISLAEESGLIIPIGEWVLREACSANKRWQEQGLSPITVSVNLSPMQFIHQDIAQVIANILHETGLEAKYLELEITETTVMDDVEHAISKLKDIQSMGVEIALDDFGTGYTSIGHLKQFPISTLKIDQSFIKNLPESNDDTAIVSAVVAMAHNLGLKVVAEGVETEAHLHYLADIRCDMIQGYYFSRPLPETEAVTLLKSAQQSILCRVDKA